MQKPEAVVFDVGNVLVEWQPERYYDSRIGSARRHALFAAVDLPEIYARVEDDCDIPAAALLFTDDRPENIGAAAAQGWQTHLFTGPDAWADRLVEAGLLTAQEALP